MGWNSKKKKRQILKNTVNIQQKVNKKFGFMAMRKISRKVNSRLMEGLQKWQGKKKKVFLRFVQTKRIMHGLVA